MNRNPDCVDDRKLDQRFDQQTLRPECKPGEQCRVDRVGFRIDCLDNDPVEYPRRLAGCNERDIRAGKRNAQCQVNQVRRRGHQQHDPQSRDRQRDRRHAADHRERNQVCPDEQADQIPQAGSVTKTGPDPGGRQDTGPRGNQQKENRNSKSEHHQPRMETGTRILIRQQTPAI